MTGAGIEVELRLADPPPCPRCDGPALLLVAFPHSWQNGRGQSITGTREAVLCPECDRGDPPAHALLALFASDRQIGFTNAQGFSELVADWVAMLRTRTVDQKQLAVEEACWRREESGR